MKRASKICRGVYLITSRINDLVGVRLTVTPEQILEKIIEFERTSIEQSMVVR